MFVVCGEALMDLFSTETENGLMFAARVGGSSFNVAVGLARLGQPSALYTGISTDPLGERLVEALDREHVRTDLLERLDRPTTLSVVNLTPDGQPSYAFYGNGAADREIGSRGLPTFGPDVWGLHAGSYSLVVEPVGDTLLRLFEREAGRRLLTLDPNVRLNVEPDAALWRERIARFVAHADVVKVSDEDLGLLYPGATGPEIAGAWLDAGAALVIITRGPGGAEYFVEGGRRSVAGRSIEVTDTVGAGDTFQAALIAGLSELGIWTRSDLVATSATERLVAFAISAAAITCTRQGADLPHRVDLSEFLLGSS